MNVLPTIPIDNYKVPLTRRYITSISSSNILCTWNILQWYLSYSKMKLKYVKFMYFVLASIMLITHGKVIAQSKTLNYQIAPLPRIRSKIWLNTNILMLYMIQFNIKFSFFFYPSLAMSVGKCLAIIYYCLLAFVILFLIRVNIPSWLLLPMLDAD